MNGRNANDHNDGDNNGDKRKSGNSNKKNSDRKCGNDSDNGDCSILQETFNVLADLETFWLKSTLTIWFCL